MKQGLHKGVGVERLGLELALAQYQLGQRTDSIATYEKIITEIPNPALSKNNLSMILVDDQASESDINKAHTYVADLEKLEEAASLDTAGWVNFRAGNIAKSIEVLEKAVSLAPNAAELHYHLGFAYAAEGGDIEMAKQHLKIAAESDQNYNGKEKAKAKLKQLTI